MKVIRSHFGLFLILTCAFQFALGQAPAAVTGAPPPGQPPKASPLTAEEEQTTFTLPPGFEIELVAADPDLAKVVTVVFDDAGRMWTITAVEYPVDANETPERAKQLYENPGRDRVLVFDSPTAPGRQRPRTFAEGLAIPLGILPWRNGVIVGHGQNIVFLKDTDGDGKADQRETLLGGFGVQDSHLFPHQFTRGPGGWIYLAQGAFNYSKVKGRDGTETDFNQTKLARFRPDGTAFEIVCWGPNNIWGFVIDRQGEMFIQEANDLGYPVVPYFVGAAYPGIGMHKPKPYAPWQPPLATHFEMGGTGLSGLALCEDRDSFPPPYRDVMYVANPITRQIQAVKIQRDGNPESRLEAAKNSEPAKAGTPNTGAHYRLEKLPDFINSSDPWFRPVAIHFGPDGCLYIVDWYNKIISHNEVPRDHPDRDKTRGRIWRVRHKDMPQHAIPDLTRVSDKDLVKHLAADSIWEARAAWHQIVDRKAVSLAPQLHEIVAADVSRRTTTRVLTNAATDVRILALWSLEGLGTAELVTLKKLVSDPNRNLRREAVRVLGTQRFSLNEIVSLLDGLAEDPDPQVRAEVIRTLDRVLVGRGVPTAPLGGSLRTSTSAQNQDADGTALSRAVTILLRMAKPQMDGPIVRPQQGGDPTYASGPAADRAFERYLVRAALEKNPVGLTASLDSPIGRTIPLENRMLAYLGLGGRDGAKRLAASVAQLGRALAEEELALLAGQLDEAVVKQAFGTILDDTATQTAMLNALLRLAPRLNNPGIAPLLGPVLKARLTLDPSDDNYSLSLRLASVFKIADLEPDIVAYVTKSGQTPERKLVGLKALREIGSSQLNLFQQLALAGKTGEPLQREAITALASAKGDRAVAMLLEMWSVLPRDLRKLAVDRLAGSRAGGQALLQAIQSGSIGKEEMDEYTLEKLRSILGDDSALAELQQSLAGFRRPVLRLNGQNGDYVPANIDLEGPFTVETWIKLDPGINNHDGILATPGQADFNFHDARFRVWDRDYQDVIIARQPILADRWTHVAVSRNAKGEFKTYLNGELDNEQGKPSQNAYKGLAIGRTLPPNGGTAGTMNEFRVWTRERTAEEIRDSYRISFAGEPRPAGLAHYFSGDSWAGLHGGARVIRTTDYPPLLTVAEARALNTKFDQFRQLTGKPGDIAKGKALFSTVCMVCHNVQGQGGQIGPTLNGAGAMGPEALLRSVLTPNAAVESGYYRYRIETTDGELLEGFLASQDENAVLLRQPNSEDQRIPRSRMKRAFFTKTSMMPEGLLEGLKTEEVADLFAYLGTLK